MSTFKSLGVKNTFCKALAEMNIVNPTAIQEETIPVLLSKKTDFVGLAQTGTGKTAAFGLPILHRINPSKPEIQALILSPTRELVQQIKKQLFKFTKYTEHKIFTEGVYGGEKIDLQINALRRPTHIVVATPGRLIDLLERKALDISMIKTLVLDEADEMLSMGFKQELDQILSNTQGSRHTWLFSATMPDEIKRIINDYMDKKAIKVTLNNREKINANINHQYVITSLKEKFNTLIKVLEGFEQERGIIFARTKLGAQSLFRDLQNEGFSVGALEGDMQQKERDKVMRAFKNKSLQILISTDVAARGIDVQDLSFVIHHQLPEQLHYYTHRSGRTARAGKTGKAIALILPSELQQIHQIQKALEISFEEVLLT
ncbi:DEAD/DEAH box helicase [Flavobacteriaceae bacterium F08102]|nr:DEAD/DEAH box helicase [Flavobacteriaceae bacterium F08102]